MARGRRGPDGRPSLRRVLDEWHGTVARYAGLILLVYSAAVDRFKNPAILPGAIGLIFLKNVTGNGRDDDKDGE